MIIDMGELLLEEKERLVLKILKEEKLCKKEIDNAVYLGVLNIAG